jgi:outer membrane murein-binding lipoprotein Lpp
LLVTQEANATYASYGVDGSTVAGITWDGGNMEFDFNDADNQVAGGDIAAWYFYFITTATGIAEAFGAISWPQINRVSNRTAALAITFDNTKADPLKITGAWIDRDDGATIIASASNSIQIDPPAVFIKETGISGLTPAESAKLDLISTVDGKVDTIDTVVDAISANVTTLDGKVDTIDTVVDVISANVTTVDGKVDQVKNNTALIPALL